MATDTSSTTLVVSYFISNHPPFSQWTSDSVAQIDTAWDLAAPVAVPLCRSLPFPSCLQLCKV